METAVAVDVETTGLNPFMHQVTSIALVSEDGGAPLEVFVDHDDLVWTPVAFGYFHKYQERWRAEKVTVDEAYEKVCGWLRSNVSEGFFVGHNVSFDLGFMAQLVPSGEDPNWPGMSHRSFDTATALRLANLLGAKPPRELSLGAALEQYSVDLQRELAHTAIGDATATLELYWSIIREFTHPYPRPVR